jgi:hypothetical protein
VNQIKQEQFNLQHVREMMMKNAEEQEQSRPPYVYECNDLYRDSCTFVLPPSNIIQKGFPFLDDDDLKRAMD